MWWWLLATANAANLDEVWVAAEGHAAEPALAEASVEAAQARVGSARAALLPKVALSASYTWNDEAIEMDLGKYLPEQLAQLTGPIAPITVQPQRYGQASATLVQPLVDLDGWATLRAAGLAARAAGADRDDTDRRVKLGVAEVFYGVILSREAVALSEEAARVATRQQAVAQALADTGAPPYAVLQAQAAVASAERDVLAAVANQTRAEEALHLWTGLARDTKLERGAAPAALPGPGAGGADRADLRAALTRHDAATAAVTAADLRWAPDINARVTTLFTQNQGFAPNGEFIVGAVEATWTFDGGYRSAQAREARAQADLADHAATRAAQIAEEERAVAQAELRRAKAAEAAAHRQVTAAEEALRQAEAAFGAGAIAFVDVERAALAAHAARVALLSEEVARELAGVRVGLVGTPRDLTLVTN